MLSRGRTTSATRMYRQCNHSIHINGGMTVMSLFATPPTLGKNGHGLWMSHCIKPKSTAYLRCQIVLQWWLSQNFRLVSNVQVTLKQNYTKRNNIKHDLPIFFHGFSWPFWPYSAKVSEIDHIFLCLVMCNHLLYKIWCYLTTQFIVR